MIAEETGGAGVVAAVVSARRRELLPPRLSVQLHRPCSGLGQAATVELGVVVLRSFALALALYLIAGTSRRDDRAASGDEIRRELRSLAGGLALEVKGLGLEVLVLGAGLPPERCVVLGPGALDPEHGLENGDLGLELADLGVAFVGLVVALVVLLERPVLLYGAVVLLRVVVLVLFLGVVVLARIVPLA